MVQFLDWEGLRGRGLTGDLDSILTTWMDWNGLEWVVMAFNGYFIPTHSNPFQSCWNFHQNHPLCHWNSFQFIPTHSNSFQLIPTHSNPVDVSIKITLYVIPTHSNPFQSILIHSNSFQSILIHSNSFQLSLNPPINPYLLAPPILGTQLKRTNNSSFWRFHSSPFKFSFGLYPKG